MCFLAIFHSGNILDMVMCLHTERVGCVDVLAPFSNCSHGIFYSLMYIRKIIMDLNSCRKWELCHGVILRCRVRVWNLLTIFLNLIICVFGTRMIYFEILFLLRLKNSYQFLMRKEDAGILFAPHSKLIVELKKVS